MTTASAARLPMAIALLPINELKPHEKGSPLYLELLKEEIDRDGVLKHPIIVDEKTHVILDGMHRWLALKSLGCALVPVIVIDALQNPKIRIGRRRIHRYLPDPNQQIPLEQVISSGLKGHLLRPRTTRHFFPFGKPRQINYPLSSLERKAPSDVSRYLATMTREDCNLAIKDWLEELSEELAFLNERKKEIEQELEEFLSRIKHLDGSIS